MNTIERFLGTLALAFVMAAAAGSAQAQSPVAFSKAFAPDSIGPGSTSTLTFSIENTSGTPVTDLAFSDILPGDVTIADGSGSTTCLDATLSAPSSGTTITLSDGGLGAFSTCTVTVNVTSSTPDTHANVSGSLTYMQAAVPGNAGTASDELTVVTSLPGFSKSITPSSIQRTGTTTVTYTIDNSANTSFESFSFNETFPAGITIASPSNASTDCSLLGSLTANSGSSTVTFDGGFISDDAICTVSVDITASTVGTFQLISSQLNVSPSQLAGASSAQLSVSELPAGEMSITKRFIGDPIVPGGTVTLEFTLTNPDADENATAVTFGDDLDAMLSGAVALAPAPTDPCGTGSVMTTGSNPTLTGGAIAARSSCTFSITVQVPAGAGSVGNHLNTTGTVSGDLGGTSFFGEGTGSDTLIVASAAPLTITKDFTNDPVAPGTAATLEFMISNPNDSEATDVEFEDIFNAFGAIFTFDDAPTDPCGIGSNVTLSNPFDGMGSNTPGDVVLTGGTIAANGSCTFSVILDIKGGTPNGSYPNTSGRVTATVGGNRLTGSSGASDTLVVGGGGVLNDFDMSKTFAQGSAAVESDVQITFVLQNPSPDVMATDISFTDDLEAFFSGTTFKSLDSDTCVGSASGQTTGSFAYSGGSLGPLDSCEILITVTLGDTLPSPANRTNTTSSVTAGADGGTAAAIVGTEASADLTISEFQGVIVSKSFTDDPVIPGASVTLQFTVRNPNPTVGAASIFFQDDLNDSVDGLVSTSATQNNICGAGSSLSGTSTLVFSGGTLTAGAECTFSVTLDVPDGIADDPYTNVTTQPLASINGGAAQLGTAGRDVLIVNSTLLEFTKEFTDDPVVPGTDAELTFTIVNTTSQAVTDIAFSDDLETMLSGAAFTSMATTNTCMGTGTQGGVFDYSGGSLAANDTCTVTIPVSIPLGAAPGDYPNTTSDVTGTAGALTFRGDAASDTLEVEAQFPPTFTKFFDDDDPVLSGDSVVLKFTIGNTDPGNALDGLAFSDDIGTMMLPGATFSGAPPNPCGGTLTLMTGGTLLQLADATAPADGECTFNVMVNVPDTAPALAGDFVNTTSDLTSNGLKQAGPATDTLTVTPSADLAITIIDSVDPVVPGTAMSFAVDVENLGPQDAEAVVVDITLPTKVTFVSTAGCTDDPNADLTCSLGTIARGDVASFTINVTVNADAVDAFDTLVEVSSTLDPNDTNDSATENTKVEPSADISVTKDITDPDVSAGGPVEYTITVLNSGPSDDPLVSVTDTFPPKLTACTYMSIPADGSLGNTVSGSDNISDFLSLPVGESVTYTAACTVDIAASDDLVNTAIVLGSFDPNNSNDSAMRTDAITEAVLDFSKVFMPDSISQGNETVLIFTIDNSGNVVDATGMDFDDPLPPGVTVSNSTPFDNGCGGVFTADTGADTVTLIGGNVDAGDSCTISVTVVAIEDGPQLNETSALTSTFPEAPAATATLTVERAEMPLFTKAFDPATIYQGDETILTFTIDNSANAINAEDLVFDDPLGPIGAVVADMPDISNDCGGMFTADAGTDTVDLAGGLVLAGESCEISVTIRALNTGSFDNVTSALTSSSVPEALAATATLTVNAAGAPLFSKAFEPDTIDQGEETVLTFTIDNSANAIDAETLVFEDALAAIGAVVADMPAVMNDCGGMFTADAGTDTVDLAGGLVLAGEFCEISVTIRALDAGSFDNVTSALTSSSVPEALAATATLTVNAAGAPLFSKAFAPDTIDQGQETVLTFTIDNSANDIDAETLVFDDPLAAIGAVVADMPAVMNDCGGIFTADAGTDTVDLANGLVLAGEICEISVTIRALDAGTFDNVTSALTSSSVAEAAPATDTLIVNAAGAPLFSKAFAPDTIDQGEETVLTFTIDNAANAIEAAMLDFDDPLPSGVLVAASPNASNGCGGTFTAAAGAGTVDLTNGTVAAGAVCEISVRVRAFEHGDILNTTSLLASSLGDGTEATATLRVNALPPGFSKAFTPDTIVVTGISRLAFLIDNSAASIPATDLDFTDVLPTNLVIAANPNVTNTCIGGDVSALAGGTTIAYANGTVAAFDRCIVSVDVTSDVVGSYPNTSGELTSSLGNSGTASATLTVEVAQVGTLTILQFTDFDGIYNFTSDEPDLNFMVPTEEGFGSIGPITLAAGSYTLTQTRPTGVGNLEVFCSDDDSTGDRKSGVLTVNIDVLEAVTCSFVSIKTDQITIDIINAFLTKRANLILSNQPELARRLERLARGFDSSSPVSFSNGDLGAMTPFTFNPLSLGSGQYRFSTSLAQVERAAASIALAHGDIAAQRFVENRRFDAWVEMSYQKFDDNAANDGHFGIAFAGVDYLFTEDLLIGAVLQVDDMKDSDDATSSTVSGLGWMFGPYVTARVAPNLYFDARLAYGRSTNEVSPFNTYTDTFDGERWLVSAGLTGEFKKGPWTIRPSANLSYFEETQAGYVDSLGATIPSQTVALGQIQIGPTISGRFETANGVIYQPSLTIDGIYNFGETRGVTVTNPDTPHTEGFRARIKAGVNFTNEMGTRIGISGIYDGIGQSDFESLGLSFDLNIPLYKAKAR